MYSRPRQALRELIVRFGDEVGRDARRCKALLLDACGGSHKKEIFALTSAVAEQIPTELQSSVVSIPRSVLVTRYSRQMHENLGLSPELCQWTVETWIEALEAVPQGVNSGKLTRDGPQGESYRYEDGDCKQAP